MLLNSMIFIWFIGGCAGWIFIVIFLFGRLFDCVGSNRMTSTQSCMRWWSVSSPTYKLYGFIGIPAVICSFFLEATGGGYMFSKVNGDYLGKKNTLTIMTQRAYNRMMAQVELRDTRLSGTDTFPVGDNKKTDLAIQWQGTTNEVQRIAFTKYAVMSKYPEGQEVKLFVAELLSRNSETMSNLAAFVENREKKPQDYSISDELSQFTMIANALSEPLKKFGISVKSIKLQPSCGCP